MKTFWEEVKPGLSMTEYFKAHTEYVSRCLGKWTSSDACCQACGASLITHRKFATADGTGPGEPISRAHVVLSRIQNESTN